MARPKGRPKAGEGKVGAAVDASGRATIINLKGSQAQADWLDTIHRKTHIPKSVIVRLALTEWAQRNGHPAFPASGGEE